MTTVTKKWLKDAGERIFWTAAQAIIGIVIVEVSGINETWAVLIIPALTVLKTLVAKKVGQADSAAIAPPSN